LRKIDDYLLELLRVNNYDWLKKMICFGNIKVEPRGFIGTKRNADLLVTIYNFPYNGNQKVAIEVENDYKFDVDQILCKIKKDQPCPTLVIIPKENERDAWQFQENEIKVWLWNVKRKWKCGHCNGVFATASKKPPSKCLNEECGKGGEIVLKDFESDNKPFEEAPNNPSIPWGELQEKLRPRGFFFSVR